MVIPSRGAHRHPGCREVDRTRHLAPDPTLRALAGRDRRRRGRGPGHRDRAGRATRERSFGIANASPIYLLAVVVVGSRSAGPRGDRHDARRLRPLRRHLHRAGVVVRGRRPRGVARPPRLPPRRRRDRATGRHGASGTPRPTGGPARLGASSRSAACSPPRHRPPMPRPRSRSGSSRDVVLTRVWIAVDERGGETVLTDTSGGATIAAPSVVTTLVRAPGDEPARWARTHRSPASRVPGRREAYGDGTGVVLRVPMEVGPDRLGSHLGAAGACGWAPDARADAGPRPRRRPDGPRDPARAASRGGDGRGGGQAGQFPQELAARRGVARPADTAREHPRARGRDWRTPRAVDRRRAPRGRRSGSTRKPLASTGWCGRSSTLAASAPALWSRNWRPHDLVAVVGAVLDRLRPVAGDRPISARHRREAAGARRRGPARDGGDRRARERRAARPRHRRRCASRPRRPTSWVDLTIEDGGPGVAGRLDWRVSSTASTASRTRPPDRARPRRGPQRRPRPDECDGRLGDRAPTARSAASPSMRSGCRAGTPPDEPALVTVAPAAPPTSSLVEDDEATRDGRRRGTSKRTATASRTPLMARPRSARGTRSGRTSCCWTSACPTWTGRTSSDVRRDAATPILILTARAAERDKVAGPRCRRRRLRDQAVRDGGTRARVTALLRRAGGPAADSQGRLRLGRVVLDIPSRVVTVGGTVVDLTPREYELLKAMLQQPGRVLTKGRLLRAVWGTAMRTRPTTCTCTSAGCAASSRPPIPAATRHD